MTSSPPITHTQNGTDRIIESLSLIDAVMPEVIESRRNKMPPATASIAPAAGVPGATGAAPPVPSVPGGANVASTSGMSVKSEVKPEPSNGDGSCDASSNGSFLIL